MRQSAARTDYFRERAHKDEARAACRCVADFVKSQWPRGKARGSVRGSWPPEACGETVRLTAPEHRCAKPATLAQGGGREDAEEPEGRTEMELSAIGEQVFAVESIVKKRVRKVAMLEPSRRCRPPPRRGALTLRMLT